MGKDDYTLANLRDVARKHGVTPFSNLTKDALYTKLKNAGHLSASPKRASPKGASAKRASPKGASPKGASPKGASPKGASAKRKSSPKLGQKNKHLKKDCHTPNVWVVGKGCFSPKRRSSSPKRRSSSPKRASPKRRSSSPKRASPKRASPKFEIPTECNIRKMTKPDIVALIKSLYSKHIKSDHPKLPAALKKDALVVFALEARKLAEAKLRGASPRRKSPPKACQKRTSLKRASPKSIEAQLAEVQAPHVNSREYMAAIEQIQRCLGLI